MVIDRGTDKKEISIEQIRSLKRFVSLSPFERARKFVLIDDAHELSSEAANSLLKTLEEPPGETIIVLVTSRPASLPVTLRSRAVRINFYPLADSVLNKNIKIRPDDLPWIAGRIGLAVRQAQNSDDLAVVKRRKGFFDFARVIESASVKEKIDLAAEVAADEDFPLILESWLLAARYRLIQKENRDFLDLTRRIEQYRELLAKTNANARLQLQDLLLSV